jgi:hypothetical protein
MTPGNKYLELITNTIIFGGQTISSFIDFHPGCPQKIAFIEVLSQERITPEYTEKMRNPF